MTAEADRLREVEVERGRRGAQAERTATYAEGRRVRSPLGLGALRGGAERSAQNEHSFFGGISTGLRLRVGGFMEELYKWNVREKDDNFLSIVLTILKRFVKNKIPSHNIP